MSPHIVDSADYHRNFKKSQDFPTMSFKLKLTAEFQISILGLEKKGN